MKTLNKLKNIGLFLQLKRTKNKSNTIRKEELIAKNKYGTFTTNQSDSLLFLINAEGNENLFI